VNFTSFAAKMMAVVAYNPIGLLVYAQLGEAADLTFVDAQEYAGEESGRAGARACVLALYMCV
jgi:hypothetical protein